MFPETDVDTIKSLRMEQKMSTTEVINVLLRETADTPSSILSQHAQNVISYDELVVKMNRAVIFSKAKALYKGAIHDPSILHKSIVVEFSGEERADVGALKNDFFEGFLRQANFLKDKRGEEFHGTTGIHRRNLDI